MPNIGPLGWATDAWLALVVHVNDYSPCEVEGVRDIDAPCRFFQVSGACMSPCCGDGHYLCKSCVHLTKEIDTDPSQLFDHQTNRV